MSFFIFILILVGALGGCVLVFFLFRYLKTRLLQKNLGFKLLLIRLPLNKEDGQNDKDPLGELGLMSQLYSALLGLKINFAWEVAVHNIGEEIHFYAAVPERAVESVSRQIQGYFPEAVVELTEDYTIFNPYGSVRAAYVLEKRNPALPLRTYEEAKIDTFLPLLSNFSKLQTAGEGLSLQILAKPARKKDIKKAKEYLTETKKGKSVTQKENGESREISMQDDEKIKRIQEKLQKPLLLVNLRVVSSAATPFRAEELLDGVLQTLSQFGSPVTNELRSIKTKSSIDLVRNYVFRVFDQSKAMLLNTAELAGIFHLPTKSTEIPRIKGIKAREAAPPQDLPKEGTLLGHSLFRGDSVPIIMTDEDRRRHLYVIGQTGTGKSSLFQGLVAQDMERGAGMAVIDPHGDLIDAILGFVPPSRYNDVIIFNPGDLERPLGMNMLEYDYSRPEQKTFIVNEMINIFDKLYDLKTTGGPMFEQYMRNALLLLMDDTIDGATLMEVPRVFSDAEFRKKKISRAKNPTVIDFWEKEAVKAGGEASLANVTPYITSKFNNFVANDYVRPIIGQLKSAFNFREIMDSKKILLVNLSKGRIGDINAGLLGMVIVGKILMAALSRVDIDEKERKDFKLYIDEFQNFATDAIATILSEARKYRLNLVVAHQFIAQLTDKISDAVFGNVGSMVVMRVGVEDAEFLEKQFNPTFTKSDLINLDNFNAAVKLMVRGEVKKPFNIKTLSWDFRKGDPEVAKKLRELSRLTYGASREEVEADILVRLRT